MRKIISAISVLTIALTLSGCIPSGNIVGKANFTTIESSFANPGDSAFFEVNGGITPTTKGLRLRITKANFSVGSITTSAAKINEILPDSVYPRDLFKFERLKGKNPCGYITGTTKEDIPFVIALLNPESGIENPPGIPPNSQILAVVTIDNYWFGYAPANSLKIGGRNLCNNFNP